MSHTFCAMLEAASLIMCTCQLANKVRWGNSGHFLESLLLFLTSRLAKVSSAFPPAMLMSTNLLHRSQRHLKFREWGNSGELLAAV